MWFFIGLFIGVYLINAICANHLDLYNLSYYKINSISVGMKNGIALSFAKTKWHYFRDRENKNRILNSPGQAGINGYVHCSGGSCFAGEL